MTSVAVRQAQAAPTSEPFLGEDSLFSQREVPFKHRAFNDKYVVISPQTAVSIGGTHDFLVTREADLVGAMFLEVTLSALSSGQSYEDYVGYALCKTIEIIHGSETVETIRPDRNFVQNELMRSQDKRDDVLVLGGLSSNQRIQAATAAQKVYVPIMFFGNNEKDFLPIFMLNQELKIRVNFETSANICDGTATISGGKLHYEAVKLSREEQHVFKEELESAPNVLGRPGHLVRHFMTVQHKENQAIASGDTSKVIQPQFAGPVRSMAALFRLSSNVPEGFSVLREWTDFKFTTPSETITPLRTLTEQQRIHLPLITAGTYKGSSLGQAPIMFETWSRRPWESGGWGHLNTQPVQNQLELTVTFADPAAAARIDVLAWFENYWYINKNGDLRKLATW